MTIETKQNYKIKEMLMVGKNSKKIQTKNHYTSVTRLF